MVLKRQNTWMPEQDFIQAIYQNYINDDYVLFRKNPCKNDLSKFFGLISSS